MKNINCLLAFLFLVALNSPLSAQSPGSDLKTQDGLFNRAVTISYGFYGGIRSEINPLNKGFSIFYSRGFLALPSKSTLQRNLSDAQIRYYPGERVGGKIYKNKGAFVGLFSQKYERTEEKTSTQRELGPFLLLGPITTIRTKYIKESVVSRYGVVAGYKHIGKRGLTLDFFGGIGMNKERATFSDEREPEVTKELALKYLGLSLGWSF